MLLYLSNTVSAYLILKLVILTIISNTVTTYLSNTVTTYLTTYYN